METSSTSVARLSRPLRVFVLLLGFVGITLTVLTLSRYLRDRDAEAERLNAAVGMIRSSGGVVFTTPADPMSLASVDLSRARTDTAILQSIREFKEIQRLNLTGQDLQADEYRQLFQIVGLKELILDDSSVSDEDLAYLPPGLTNLSLQGTSVSDSGIRHLDQLASLVSLNLANTTLTSGALALLESLESLQSLRIDDVCITPESGQVLPRMQLHETNVLITEKLGKESYEVLKRSRAANIRGRHAEGYVLWDAAIPWAHTLAGVVEAVVTECNLESEQQNQLLDSLASVGNFGPKDNQPPQSLVAASWVQMLDSSKEVEEIESIQALIVELQKSFNDAHLKGIRQYAREKFTADDIPALLEASRSDYASRESIFRVLSPFLLVQHGMENPEVVEELDRLLGQKSTCLATVYAFGSGGSIPFYSANEYEPSQAADAFAVTRLLKIVDAENRSELVGDACIILAEIAHRRPEYAPSILPAIIESLSIPNSAWQREAGKHLSRIAKAVPQAAVDIVPRLRAMLAQIDQQGSEVREKSPQVNDPVLQRHRNAVLESLSAIAAANPDLSEEIALDYLSRLQDNKVAGPFAPLLSLEKPDVTCRVVSELLSRRSDMASELHSVAIAIRDLGSQGDD